MVTKLKMILLEKKMKQRELAKKVGVHESTMSNYVTGFREPDRRTKGKIAKVLKYRMNEIWE